MNNQRFGLLSAFGDSITYRFAVALVSLGLGAFASPTLYGFYASLLIPIGFFQACIEGLIRGSSTNLFTSEASSRLVLNFSRKAAVVATPALILYSLFLAAKSQYTWVELAMLSPLLLTPAVVVNSAWVQRIIQIKENWRLIALRRIVVTTGTLPICLFFVITEKSLLAASLFMPLTEFLIYLTIRKSLPLFSNPQPIETNLISVRREIGEFIPFQARYWMITQSDRFVVGLVATANLSGLYLLASAIARLPGEITTGTLNAILRNKLRLGVDELKRSSLVEDTIQKLRVLNALAIVVISILVALVLAKINPELEAIIYLVPLLMSPMFLKDAASTVWTRSIFEEGVQGKVNTQTLSILLTLACGVVVSQNLVIGTIAVALREILTSAWIVWKWRKYARAWILVSAGTLSASCFLVFTLLAISN
jgi:hypothetical protein